MDPRKFLENTLGLSIGDIGPIALTLGIAVIVISVVSLVLGNMVPQTYDALSVTNETFNATSDPYTYTVNEAGDTTFVELTDVTCYSDAGSTALADSACNVTDAGAGDVKLSTTVDSGDEAVDYDYDEETTATSITDKGLTAMETFGDWFNIITIVAVASIILGLVMLFRSSTNRGGKV